MTATALSAPREYSWVERRPTDFFGGLILSILNLAIIPIMIGSVVTIGVCLSELRRDPINRLPSRIGLVIGSISLAIPIAFFVALIVIEQGTRGGLF